MLRSLVGSEMCIRDRLHIDFFWAMLIAALVVLVYTFAGGLFSSAYTDIFQIYLAIGAFWAAFIFFAGGFAGVDFGTILGNAPPSYTHLRAHETPEHLVCRLLLE